MSTESPEPTDLSDEEVARRYTWLTNQAGPQLQDSAGGSLHAPVFSRLSVEQLRQIADVANSLAEYHSDASEVEDPSLTPFDELPEDAQTAVREQEAADAAADEDGEPVKTQEQRIREGESQVESNPHPLEDASGVRPGQTVKTPAAKTPAAQPIKQEGK